MVTPIKWKYRQILEAAPSNKKFTFQSLKLDASLRGYMAFMRKAGLIEFAGELPRQKGESRGKIFLWRLSPLGRKYKRDLGQTTYKPGVIEETPGLAAQESQTDKATG